LQPVACRHTEVDERRALVFCELDSTVEIVDDADVRKKMATSTADREVARVGKSTSIFLLALAVAACGDTSGGGSTDASSGSGGGGGASTDATLDAVAFDSVSDAAPCDIDGGCGPTGCCYYDRCIANGETCSANDVCYVTPVAGGSCQACGHAGQPCCESGVCLDGSRCVASPQGYRCLT
jgi:hypothetical protein